MSDEKNPQSETPSAADLDAVAAEESIKEQTANTAGASSIKQKVAVLVSDLAKKLQPLITQAVPLLMPMAPRVVLLLKEADEVLGEEAVKELFVDSLQTAIMDALNWRPTLADELESLTDAQPEGLVTEQRLPKVIIDERFGLLVVDHSVPKE